MDGDNQKCFGEKSERYSFPLKPDVYVRNLPPEMTEIVRSVLDPSLYIVYRLSDDDWKRDLWQKHTQFLIVSDSVSSESQREEAERVKNYVKAKRGTVLILSYKDGHKEPSLADLFSISNSPSEINSGTWDTDDRTSYCTDDTGKCILVTLKVDSNDVLGERIRPVLTRMGIKCLTELPGQPKEPFSGTQSIFYACKSTATNDTETLGNLATILEQTSNSKVELLPYLGAMEPNFSFSDYHANVTAESRIGRHVFWVHNIPSSFTLLQSVLYKLPKHSGLVLVSAQQSAGVGRCSRQWISPSGAACFTLHVDLPLGDDQPHCKLPELLAWLQHIGALAVCRTLRKFLQSCEDVDVRIKWPNDVFVHLKREKSCFKVAGILSTASCSNASEFRCLYGIGINVANSKPTTCLHDVIRSCSRGEKSSPTVQLPSVAAVIGQVVREIEGVIILFENGASEDVRKDYTSSWMHTGESITVRDGVDLIDCTIVGVNNFGYLRVRKTRDGEIMTILPDGNSIDLLGGTVVLRDP